MIVILLIFIAFIVICAAAVKSTKESVNNEMQKVGFIETRRVANLVLDEKKKMFASAYFPHVYKYSEVLKYEIRQGQTIIKTNDRGGIGRAIVGGVLFGGVGAVVGAATSSKSSTVKNKNPSVIIYTSSKEKPTLEILCASMSDADNIAATLEQIMAETIDKSELSQEKSFSASDELIKLKSLLDSGVLTQEEFDTEKKKILSK